MLNVAVASKNPVKLEATKEAFKKIFSEDINILAQTTPSGVSDQPMSDMETLQGAYNRAYNLYKDHKNIKADFYVGIEGGVELIKTNELGAFAWIYIIDSEGNEGKARSGMFLLPEEVSKLVLKGIELGTADDMVFKDKNSKQKQGSVGIMTKGIFTRASFYQDTIILALIPFMHKQLYFSKKTK